MNTPPNPEEAIVDAALEIPAHERAAYLDKLCGNDRELRDLVDALLHAHKKIIASEMIHVQGPPVPRLTLLLWENEMLRGSRRVPRPLPYP